MTVKLRLLSNRRDELVAARIQAVCRIHRDLVVLLPGGSSKRLLAKHAREIAARIRPRDEIGKLRRKLLVDQIKDLEAVDRRIAAVNAEIKAAVAAAPTRLTKLYGLGAINTARILGEVGDVARFKSRHHFASYNGTAPTVWGSGGPATPMVNPKGNRKLNHAIHIAAVTQVRSKTSAGHAYYARKRAQGKTDREAMRALKRKISDAIYRQLVDDDDEMLRGPGAQAGTTPKTSVTGSTPTAGSSVKPQPGPRPKTTPHASLLDRGVPLQDGGRRCAASLGRTTCCERERGLVDFGEWLAPARRRHRFRVLLGAAFRRVRARLGRCGAARCSRGRIHDVRAAGRRGSRNVAAVAGSAWRVTGAGRTCR